MKMHCLGNDFVVIDSRTGSTVQVQSIVSTIANRRFGVGCDQLVEIKESEDAFARLEFYNADGSSSSTCGNATRCVGRYFMDQNSQSSILLETDRGLLTCEKVGDLTRVNLGHPSTRWQDIPLSKDIDTLHLPLDGSPCAIGFGNPHCVFFVDDLQQVDIETEGPRIEHSALFPERTNVEFVKVLSRGKVEMIIWERGAGRTKASGSGASAAAVAAMLRNLVEREVTVCLEGGNLVVEWKPDGIWMTGLATHVFNGVITDQYRENEFRH